jgi:cytolysin (calcineurin-like family phosphatase)
VGGRGARGDGAGRDLGASWRCRLVDCSLVCGGKAIERHPGKVLDMWGVESEQWFVDMFVYLWDWGVQEDRVHLPLAVGLTATTALW